MKIFRNPWVVGFLVVVAVTVVAYQTFNVRGQHAPSPTAVANPAAAPAVNNTKTKPAPADLQPTPAPVSAIDRNYLDEHWAGWTDTPQRDPFLLLTKRAARTVPMSQFKLKAIWRQDGVTLAAINQGIYRLGDVFDNWIVVAIHDNEVLLENNGQQERLGFAGQEPVTAPK